MSIPPSGETNVPPEIDSPPPHDDPERGAEVQHLVEQLEATRQRVNELAYALQASERDREAFKQRQLREREQLLEVERGNVAVALLEAVDELDRCLDAADDSPLAQGVRLIREGMLRRAESAGLERLELAGRPFDPAFAEATGMELTGDEADDGKIVAVLKACYLRNGRVVRPGQVKVARYVKPAAA